MKAALLLASLVLAGCASLEGIGCWVQNEDPRYSFTLGWIRKDPAFEEPTRSQWEVINELLQQRAEAP